LPSGIVRPGKVSVIGNGVVVDPYHLVKEVGILRGQGVEVSPKNLKLAENAPLILSLHRELDAHRESAATGGTKIGTTMRGIGPAYEDKVGRRSIRVMDLAEPDTLDDKITRLLAHHNPLRHGLGLPEITAKQVRDELLAVAPEVLPYMDATWELLDTMRRQGQRILFEGAQGALLDVDHGTYPFVTSSNTTAANAATGSGMGPRSIGYVLGIAKAYTTRVGGGPFPTELTDEIGQTIGERGHEFGTVTGRARRCGWFDAPIARFATRVNGLTDIFLTKLDVLTGFEQIPVCVAYDIDGVRSDEVPMTQTEFHHAKPIYENLPGWSEDISGAQSLADLPKNARDYVAFLEEISKTRISAVGVGQDRNATIAIHDLIK